MHSEPLKQYQWALQSHGAIDAYIEEQRTNHGVEISHLDVVIVLVINDYAKAINNVFSRSDIYSYLGVLGIEMSYSNLAVISNRLVGLNYINPLRLGKKFEHTPNIYSCSNLTYNCALRVSFYMTKLGKERKRFLRDLKQGKI